MLLFCLRLARTTIFTCSLAVLVIVAPQGIAQAADPTGLGLTMVENRMIWEQSPSNAFTDLIRYQDQFYCAFREGASHGSEDGSIRILASPDCQTWTPVAQINSTNNLDLRDPKFSITPAGQLMLTSAERDITPRNYQSMVWFSNDGAHWAPAKTSAIPTSGSGEPLGTTAFATVRDTIPTTRNRRRCTPRRTDRIGARTFQPWFRPSIIPAKPPSYLAATESLMRYSGAMRAIIRPSWARRRPPEITLTGHGKISAFGLADQT